MRFILVIVLFAIVIHSQEPKMPVATTLSSDMPAIEPGVSHELAKWRAAHYSNIRYKLSLTLEKMSPVLKGSLEVKLQISALPKGTSFGGGLRAVNSRGSDVPPIILDWRKIRGHEDKSTISNITLNGRPVSLAANWPPADAGGSDFNEHLIFRDGVVVGENVIRLDFTSPILTSGSAITRYVDKEDGSEYIYSLFVPSDASTAFPVFDQPDLKARFTLSLQKPVSWMAISNSQHDTRGHSVHIDPPPGVQSMDFSSFYETKPISTYVFAFAAGPWERVSEPGAVATGLPAAGEKRPVATAQGTDKKADAETSIYVRKSQAAKFKPHAAEVFRLNREAVKYFEEYFDYKFPFPKYDLVLIPEFPFGGMEHAGATFLRESSIIFPQEPTKNDQINRASRLRKRSFGFVYGWEVPSVLFRDKAM